MKIVFVQSYPIYHDNVTDAQWLLMENRDKWMPALLKKMGMDTELWVVGKISAIHFYSFNNINLTIRIFKNSSNHKKSKFHYSDELIDFALQSHISHYVIKGIDGGVGIDLLKKVILPNQINYSFIIGGSYQSKYFKNASVIFFESDKQLNLIQQAKCKILKPNYKASFYKLPKSVDLELFKPSLIPLNQRKYDVISVGRLIPKFKDYTPLFELSKNHFKIGMIGSGPLYDEYKKKYPHIDWIGHVPYNSIMDYYQQTKLFFFSSKKEFFPRVISESYAVGIPVITFENLFSKDVVNENTGLLVNNKNYVNIISTLLNDYDKLHELSINSRTFAERNLHKYSTQEALNFLLKRI